MIISQVTIVGKPQPRSWKDFRDGCLANYAGGHHNDGQLEAFRHGMETVFNLLESEFPPAELCKAAPFLLDVCQKIQPRLERWATFGIQRGVNGKDKDWQDLVGQLESSISRAKGAL